MEIREAKKTFTYEGKDEITQAVIAMKGGDENAFAFIYTRTFDKMMGYARKHLENLVKDEEKMQELVQDAYMVAHKKIDTLEKPEAFMSWCYRILKLLAYNHYRKERRETTVASEEAYQMFESIVDEDKNAQPEDNMMEKEHSAIVASFVEALPEAQRTTVWLRFEQGLKMREIADIMGVSESTVKSRLRQAQKVLCKQIEAYEARTGISLH